MTGHLNLVEGTARLGFMRVAAAIDKPERQPACMDGMREIASDIPKEVIRDRPAWANHFIPRSNTNALAIPKTDARPPHPRTIARSKPKPSLRSRMAHLAFVRMLPCVACGNAASSEAAHVRTGTDGGVGVKPGDRYAVPLCTACHAKQHRIGELTFWSALRIDPLNVAFRLWVVSGDEKAGARTVFRARQHIDLAKADPESQA